MKSYIKRSFPEGGIVAETSEYCESPWASVYQMIMNQSKIESFHIGR